jgi:hypothetical protein
MIMTDMSGYLCGANSQMKRYTQNHGKAPAKYEQLVGGSVQHVTVNSYNAQDKDLIVTVLHEVALILCMYGKFMVLALSTYVYLASL